MRAMKFIHRIIIAVAKSPIHLYRKCISPALPPRCRYYPTCSEYALQAIDEWGAVCGWILAIWRVLRCNPFGKHGYDPVPKRSRKKQ